MPPRYAYWTIIVDEQPTAFRAAAQEDLMPTFKRLKEKHPSAKMVWFQNGKIWPSRVDAQEAMRARGEMGRRGDTRQAGGGFRSRSEWKPRDQKVGDDASRPGRDRSARPEWKPRDKDAVGERKNQRERGEKLDWKPKGSLDRDGKPDWKPKGSFDRERKPDWKPKGSFDRNRKPDWKPRGRNVAENFSSPRSERTNQRERGEKLEWKPRGEPKPQASSPDSQTPSPKRKWVPKAEYKKSQGIEAPRDKKWRPGGEHRDPKQKYKDAKKAKWTKFKKNIRSRWEDKTKKK